VKIERCFIVVSREIYREGLFDSCFDQTLFNLSYLTIAFFYSS